MFNNKKSTVHLHHSSPSIYLLNRIWRRKFLLIALILIFLIITISLTSSRLNAFSSLFSTSGKNDEQILHENHLKSFQPALLIENENQILKTKSADGSSGSDSQSRFHKNQFTNEQISAPEHRVPKVDFSDIRLPKRMDHQNNGGYIPKNRLIHLDLKGAPPKVSYFSKLFPLLKRTGANGLLLEYEDTFPYDGDLKSAVSGNSYSQSDLEEIKRLARENNLQIIPLVQTLGHLEFILKLQKYRHLREMDDYPQAICPSKNESFKILTNMIDQVISVHPDSKWLHIGCDEVYQIGYCKQCKFKDREDLFLAHVKRIATYLKEKYDVITIIWDDMLRQFAPETIKSYELDKLGVEIMIWTYVDDIYRFIPVMNWQSYSELFPKIWGASAFKGAFGETLTVPNVKMHLDNNIAWLKTLEEQSTNFKSIQGLVITGWQRYDHLATLCELLPSGVPSMILDLLTVTNGKFENRLLEKYHHLLECSLSTNQYYGISDRVFQQDPNFFHVANCDFPGSEIFKLMEEFESVNKRVDDYLYDVTIHKAWLTDFNFRHNITNPWRINEGLQDYASIMYSLKTLLRRSISTLNDVFDESTTYEWIEQKIYPQIIRMEKFYNQTMRIKKFKVWPKRPLKPSDDLMRIIEQKDDD